MTSAVLIRPLAKADFDNWKPLWDGYNAFYKREGPTALAAEITRMTWSRFFDPYEPVHALVAEHDGALVGTVHYLYHRSTTQIAPNCYLQDLFTLESERGKGVGRALINAVYDAARRDGSPRVYWQTHETNTPGRLLYDKVAQHLGFLVYSKMVI